MMKYQDDIAGTSFEKDIAPAVSTPTDAGNAVEQDTQFSTQQQSLDNPPPVLGGTRAWLQVLGGFLAFINIW